MIVGVGVDMVDIDRVTRLVEERGERALERVFTAGETEYAHRHPNPAMHLAARIAAKEATYKALAGNDLARAVGWRDIEVVARERAGPEIVLHGRAKERAAELGVARTFVSLSHDRGAAIAIVILERD